MALPVNIEDLLNRRKVESNRIEFKKGWNPEKIYRTICAFANDIDNLGGGYILVGVEEKDGIAVRPVEGIPIEQLDRIQKQMVGFNNMIEPFYEPYISVEDVDNKSVLAIWVPSGTKRPYTVPADVTAKLKKPLHYIRFGTSTEEAKGEKLDELREISAKVPFDDRGNSDISYDDISFVELRDYLVKVRSRLAQDVGHSSMEDLLESMNLMTGPKERKLIKNVAAMMFCEQPDRIFPYAQVDIVLFPEGREQNPDNMTEAPIIKGTVPRMIREALNYLRSNVIKERIIKVSDRQEPIKFFNYPFAALEEAVVNALYHRDYSLYEPVEITVEPHRISILSFSGPDRYIKAEDIKKAKSLRSRRYRNRRLGDFLKELGLTEGRATGIPTIQRALKANGSAPATIETDDDRTYFLIDIPCHPDFVNQPIVLPDKRVAELSDQLRRVYNIVKEFPTETVEQLAQRIGIKPRRFHDITKQLKELGAIRRDGTRYGVWVVLWESQRN